MIKSGFKNNLFIIIIIISTVAIIFGMAFLNDNVTLESYGLLDFYVSHKIIKNKMILFANVTNIFNEDYQELFGFSTRGRGVNLGFNLNL